MDMDENNRNETELHQIENELCSLTEDVQVPPSLEPEAVEEMLKEKAGQKKKAYRRKYAGLAAAACVCVVVVIAAVMVGALNSGSGRDFAAGSAKDEQGVSDASRASESTAAGEDAAGQDSAGEGSTVTELTAAEDYDEIYAYIQEEQEQAKKQAKAGGASVDIASSDQAAFSGDTAAAESALDSGAASGSASGSASGLAGYSDTNVREEGVGEADSVKTDGKNLYILDGQTVYIVDIGSEEMQALSEIRLEDDCYIREIYIEKGKLVLLYTRTEILYGEDGYYKPLTCAEVYDVSDPSSPEKINTVSQSGNYNTVRVSGGYVYLFSDFYAAGVARTDTSLYIPEVQGKLIEPSAIYMPQGKMGSSYTVISSFDLDDPSGKTDSRAVFGIGGLCYVSGNNIYITEAQYETGEVPQTSIRKLSYGDGEIDGVAQTKVNGTLNDSFCIDEYGGYLRMVVTVEPADMDDGIMPLTGLFGFGINDSEETAEESLDGGREQTVSNSLYVLNEDLEMAGEISGLAEEEYVYSARFMGDIGYFVTFKQVDPLFSADLSDPENPKIIGELKIPGFSEYLHPYGSGKLLGIGMSVDEEGMTTEGVKLSMFDVSDPENVEETANLVLEDMYGSDVFYNYRAVFVDTEKNLFGFSAYGDETEYFVFSYDDADGFQEVFSRKLSGYYEPRGLYAGERFYLIAGNTVESYALSDFEKLDDIVL